MATIKATIQVSHSVDLFVFECPNCGITFGVPDDYIAARRRDKRKFYCPNGHDLSYTENEADRLKRELEKAQKAIAEWRQDYNRVAGDADAERKSHAATKGQLTKLRKRVEAGVCPDCHRQFADLSKHMQTRHGKANGYTRDDLGYAKPALPAPAGE